MDRAPIVADVMTQVVVTVAPDTRVRDLVALLVARGISGAPIVNENGDVLGVVSTTDVLRAQTKARGKHDDAYYRADPSAPPPGLEVAATDERTVLEIGTRRVVALDERTELAQAAKHMLKLGIHRMIVTRGGRFAGILTATDILKWVARPALEEEAAEAERETRRIARPKRAPVRRGR